MAFDLVHYFTEQTAIQKPEFFSGSPAKKRFDQLLELNALVLGRIITLWRHDADALYVEIQKNDALYSVDIARHLLTSKHNQSPLAQADLETILTHISELQFNELRQLDRTSNLGKKGLNELLNGQIEHLSGQADDWVWLTNQLTELVGSKAEPQPVKEEISLNQTMQEFNHMVLNPAASAQSHEPTEDAQQPVMPPTWSKIIAPLVALAILIFLYCQYVGLIYV